MSMSIFDRQLGFQQNALNLRSYRQEVLAGNIANADTPNYKARDINFRDALLGAQDGIQQKLAMTTTSSGHLQPGNPPQAGDAYLKYRGESQSAVDGNTVDMDTERAAFAENSVKYEASLTFINGQIRSMQQAIQNQ
jgi:flagellar basal-body rod protein FlgB